MHSELHTDLSPVELNFYLATATSALQGIQESGNKLAIVSDLIPKETAKLAFDIADAMLAELRKRVNKNLLNT